jgi:hypothetical protein
MKTTQVIFSRLHLEDQEIANIKSALARDNTIVATILKILNLRKLDAAATSADYENPNWPYRRAYKDGRSDEINFLINLLSEE